MDANSFHHNLQWVHSENDVTFRSAGHSSWIKDTSRHFHRQAGKASRRVDAAASLVLHGHGAVVHERAARPQRPQAQLVGVPPVGGGARGAAPGGDAARDALPAPEPRPDACVSVLLAASACGMQATLTCVVSGVSADVNPSRFQTHVGFLSTVAASRRGGKRLTSMEWNGTARALGLGAGGRLGRVPVRDQPAHSAHYRPHTGRGAQPRGGMRTSPDHQVSRSVSRSITGEVHAANRGTCWRQELGTNAMAEILSDVKIIDGGPRERMVIDVVR